MLDDRMTTHSSQMLNGEGVWDRTSNRTGWTALLGESVGGPDVSPYAAPARAQALSGLPATYLEVGGVEVLEDAADLTGRGVDVVLGAVAVETDGIGAAAESGELTEDTGQSAVLGQLREFRKRGRCGAGEDGGSPSDWLGQE